jgi:GNAT superfamily N-acetyltransferase
LKGGGGMVIIEEYKENPCGVLSIPYWKNKRIRIPENMCVVHDTKYVEENYRDYHDEPYFRLYHDLVGVKPFALDGLSIVTAKYDDIPLLVDVINQSYTDLSVTTEQMIGYTQTEVFCPELWIAAVDNATSCIVGCGIADFDKELHEGILEWIQVIPAYRGQKIGQLLVNELLKRMANIAKFATVSGKVNNPTSPEMLYRKCGFVGNDIWHVLTR